MPHYRRVQLWMLILFVINKYESQFCIITPTFNYELGTYSCLPPLTKLNNTNMCYSYCRIRFGITATFIFLLGTINTISNVSQRSKLGRVKITLNIFRRKFRKKSIENFASSFKLCIVGELYQLETVLQTQRFIVSFQLLIVNWWHSISITI